MRARNRRKTDAHRARCTRHPESYSAMREHDALRGIDGKDALCVPGPARIPVVGFF
jgi:hypothetical protein